MAQFKTTHNILVEGDKDELFDPKWFTSDKIVYPPKKNWDYARELQIEDIDVWEVLYSQGGGLGLYAAWDPFAEFYMITLPAFKYIPNSIETYYGPKANEKVLKRAQELGIPIVSQKVWVEPEDMWLYN
jgi:hypothetical protein